MLERADFLEAVAPVLQWVNTYLQSIEKYPVKSQVAPKAIYQALPASLPRAPESIAQILKDLEEIILPGITHWQHPNFHAYFPANSSIESILGELITAAIGAQCMIWETSPAAAELEERLMEWIRDAIGLPSDFEGCIQDTASSATITAILTAREVKTDFQANEMGVPPNLRVYCSTETHSSIEKGVKICGIGSRNVVKIPVDEQQRMIPELLEKHIQEDLANGYLPTCVVAAIGTTSTVAVDPLPAIAAICKRYQVWLHIDAAYAGNALFLPEYQWMIEGAEYADSLVFNPHKWLFTNFDCSAYFVKNAEALIKTFEILPEYLKTKTRGQVNDYRDWGIPLGRRFRALKLWFVLRSYGLEGLQQKLRKHIELNHFFAEQIAQHPDLELILKPFLNFTCFRIHPLGGQQDENTLNGLNEDLIHRINQSGKAYLTHTKINGQYVIRIIFGQTYVEKRHVESVFQLIANHTKELLGTHS